MNTSIKAAIGIVSALILSSALALDVLDQHELHDAERIDLQFPHQDDHLSATLLLPEGNGPFPVVVFIHGDGPTDRFADGGYIPIMNNLLRNGIASFSWDKAGVGQSSGHWLEQTMADRANEAAQAISLLKHQEKVGNIGVLGFSQGGWVLSQLAENKADYDFMIAVGVAVNWQRQSEYLQQQRMLHSGFSNDQIDTVRQYERRVIQDILLPQAPYNEYLAFMEHNPPPSGAYAEPMSQSRYQFVARNLKVDMELGLAQIKVPFLGIFGDSDLNVDVRESLAAITKAFNTTGHQEYQLSLLPNATHSMLKADSYNFQTTSQWTTMAQLNYLLEGEDAFAEGFFDLLVNWIHGISAKEKLKS
ncbi:hypothetical protein BTA51_01980 [Hahella sp. CCB-MM4]|uniref:alpha/beta hydrolase family protein n=1 Tax=Hahella sp. (strain CCB-MM4) TaxID=1926491 RepID=UPI000B9B163E|nr:alpha/beta hydrolase [Hahella sp. CCB-MM4]OZG75177.1 hypothetical protein BTA51_01980 [Hahella sp. CCB-MM4]